MSRWSRLPPTTESVDARLVQELSTPPCLQAHECSTLPGLMMLRPYSCICDCFVSAYLLLGVSPLVYSQALPEESLAPGVRPSSGHWCCQCVGLSGHPDRPVVGGGGATPGQRLCVRRPFVLGSEPNGCEKRSGTWPCLYSTHGFVCVRPSRCRVEVSRPQCVVSLRGTQRGDSFTRHRVTAM